MSEARGIKKLVKRVIRWVMRPGVWPLTERLDQIVTRLDNQAVRLQAINRRNEGWSKTIETLSGRLDQIEDSLERLTHSTLVRDKHQEELSYWRWLIKTEDGRASLYAPFEEAFGHWQRERLKELGEALGLGESGHGELNGQLNGHAAGHLEENLDRWCSEQSVVEIGAGPYPAIAAAPAWRRAVAVDPLAKSYAEEGLLATAASRLTYLETPGEHVPLAPGFADLVIMDNALDHVLNPGAVLDEINRLLRAGGLFWILVDLSTHKDHMHPSPFDEVRLRSLFREKGFEVVSERISGHKSHPNAYGEYRGLLRRPDTRSDFEVVVTNAVRASRPRIHA